MEKDNDANGKKWQFWNGEENFPPMLHQNPQKRIFFAPGAVPPLPVSIAPVGTEMEKQIVYALIAELNKNFGLQLDPVPSLERGVVTQTGKNSSERFIVVGGSHMLKMSTYMPENTACLAKPGFRAGPSTCGRISRRLTELTQGMGDTVILDLLSNSSFMGTNDDGMPLPLMPMSGGRYHVPGSLIPTPMSIIRKTLQSCECIANAVKNSKVILIGPSPRYVSQRCCDDARHLENYNNPDYENEILGGIDSVNRTLEKWAAENELSYSLVDPIEQSVLADFPLGERVTPDGSAWWTTSDPVHLAQESYRVLASVVTSLQETEEEVVCAAGSSGSIVTDHGSDTPSSGKRKRVDSVVITVPTRATRGRVARWPAWLSGSAENYNHGWRGGNVHRGWNPNWRGGARSRSRGRHGRRGRFGRW